MKQGELVAVSIDSATAQTLMDWNVLHFTDAGWSIDLDIWRTRKSSGLAELEEERGALRQALAETHNNRAELVEANRVLREALIRARPHVAASRRPYDTAQQRYELLTDIDAALTPSGEQP